MLRQPVDFTQSLTALTTDEMDALVAQAAIEGWPASRLTAEIDRRIELKQAARRRSLN